MLIFLIIVIGPGCGFMLYALYQFSREARRFRHADPRMLKVTIVNAGDTLAGNSTPASNERTPRRAAETPEGEGRVQGRVFSTYSENCFAAMPSGTGRPAMKHSMKGSF
jgi:hypothetical protein